MEEGGTLVAASNKQQGQGPEQCFALRCIVGATDPSTSRSCAAGLRSFAVPAARRAGSAQDTTQPRPALESGA